MLCPELLAESIGDGGCSGLIPSWKEPEASPLLFFMFELFD